MYNTPILPIFNQNKKHKIFVSFHHKDEPYRKEFERIHAENFISMSVQTGDIDPENEDEHIKRLIQEDHIVNSSVIFALYGAETHKRKHIDWEISAALSAKVGGHKGLAVLLLPTFPVAPYDANHQYDPSIIYPYLHPRTAANIQNGYADLYYWPGLYSGYPGVISIEMKDVIDIAFEKRDTHSHLIENSYNQYQKNRV